MQEVNNLQIVTNPDDSLEGTEEVMIIEESEEEVTIENFDGLEVPGHQGRASQETLKNVMDQKGGERYPSQSQSMNNDLHGEYEYESEEDENDFKTAQGQRQTMSNIQKLDGQMVNTNRSISTTSEEIIIIEEDEEEDS